MYNTQKGKKLKIVFAAFFFVIALVWGCYAGAELVEDPNCENVISALITGAIRLFNSPLSLKTIYVNKDGLLGIAGALAVYGVLLLLLMVDAQRHKHFDSNATCGTAKWEKDYKTYNKQYSDPPGSPRHNGPNNMILSQNVFLNMNGHITQTNNNICCVGGSGSGKSRFFVKPNILQANCNYVVTDPKGDLLLNTGKFLEDQGYEIKIFNLVEMWKSDCYNPFNYIRNDLGVVMMINCLIKNTTPPDKKGGEAFWENSEKLLLESLSFYLYHHRPKEERSFVKVVEMLRLAEVDERNPNAKSPLDQVFDDLEKVAPESIALKKYKSFKKGAGKTLKSILISCLVRMSVFDVKELADLTSRDTIELEKMGEGKKALFVIIPSADDTYNFLVSMMYSQLFETLYHIAETTSDEKRLKRRVRFLLDEFANIGEIPQFSKKLATMRQYEISCSIILQNLAQIKNMYKDDWQTILGNCDTFIFLGGQEYETAEYISKELGEATIIQKDRGMSNGRSTSASQNYKLTSRKLKTPDEVMRLNKKKCLVLIRALHPFEDYKYNYPKHPNYPKTGDAKKKNKYVNRKDNRVFIEAEVIDMEAEREKVEKYQQAEEAPTPKTRVIGDIKNAEGLCKSLNVTNPEEVKERFELIEPTPPNPATEEKRAEDIIDAIMNVENLPNQRIRNSWPEDRPTASLSVENKEELMTEDNSKKDETESKRKYPYNPSEKTLMRNSRVTTGTPSIGTKESEIEVWDYDKQHM